MPVFRTKKEAFQWLSTGQKTIDVRRGSGFRGETAVYLSGRSVLRFRIVQRETGLLREIVRQDNYMLIIPSASSVDEAVAYLCGLYGGREGVFTAYYVATF